MTLHGADVSSYQPSFVPPSGDSFLFVKSVESTTYTNPYRADQAKAARAKKLQLGWYAFIHHGNIDAQVDYFLAHTDIKSGDLLVCDWEASGCTTADKDHWIKAVQKAKPNHRVGLYCNTNWWLNVDTSSFYGDFLWIAAYQSSKPSLQAEFKFWQYTSSPIDQNHGYFDSLADLKKWAGSGSEDSSGDDGSGTSTHHEDVWPTAGNITTPYGAKGDMWASGYHKGDDWSRGAGDAEIGDDIVAVASGTAIYADDARYDGGQGWGSAFGKHVLVEWDDHGLTSIYAHMNKINTKKGTRVTVGQKLGEKGKTGNVTGAHLHFECHTGTRWTDPDVKPIYPGKKVPTPASTDQEEFAMSEQTTQKRSKPQTIPPDGKYHELNLEDNGDKSFGFGGGAYQVDARFILAGVTAAEELLVRAFRFDTDKANDDKRIADSEAVYWVQGLAGGGGKSYRNFGWKWHVPAPPKGKGRRLRLEAANFTDHDIVVESLNTATWKAPLN